MRVVLADPLAYSDAFDIALRSACPGVEFRRWTECAPDTDYDLLVTWAFPPDMAKLPASTRAVLCLGAGTDQLTSDPRLPDDMPVLRLRDPAQAQQILDYAMHAAFARQQDEFSVRRNQSARRWQRAVSEIRDRSALSIAVLGLGMIGGHVASGLAAAGFRVSGWSRTRRKRVGVTAFHGEDGLVRAVTGADLLVNLLPSNQHTRGILDGRVFDLLAPGAYVVNLGRGDHLDETALREALDSGHVAGAWLDVFLHEPLPADHWTWAHQKVRITPHCGGLPTPEGTAAAIAEALKALADPRNPLVSAKPLLDSQNS
ncbi:NAD(P)-dependent oxidoreductase [Mesorhizobium sp.]|uniref:NAD(P)-dependent oxidoreductase n=1 Tax=Mesorhizobium sp. TaxID=1871066 RepID=UPI0025E6C756|nr:NAD(P)-dependent oxidoreductase [Mesorhizobium sp.]